jgi:hypothetical protein
VVWRAGEAVRQQGWLGGRAVELTFDSAWLRKKRTTMNVSKSRRVKGVTVPSSRPP